VGLEIDLLVNYPRTKRNVEERGQTKTEEDRRIARQFGRDFFDGDRRHGYGGFNYMPRFWQPVAPTFQQHYALRSGDSLLDVGCGKGFMLHDFALLIPGLKVKGVDVSSYAIEHAIEDMRPHLRVADAKRLPFPDKSFDVVVSINTIHNLARAECGQALREIERVARRGAFITVDAYRTDEERERMLAWNLTAQTILHVDEWKAFFAEVGYTGDYYWFIP
jgi:SAM-dependent methyltransferase